MKFEQYMKLINDTHESHVNGDLNEIEYVNAYNEILGVVIDSDTLNEEEKRQLIGIVRIKIGQVPKVEEMRKEEQEAKKQQVEQAFIEAKKRFRSFSIFQRVKLNLKGQGPEQIHRSLNNVEEINSLYKR